MRIPVLIRGGGAMTAGGAASPREGDAWLVEDGADMPEQGYAVRFAVAARKFGHFAGCTCCTLRGPAADALSGMFRARATGAAPFFNRVVVMASPEGEQAVRDALAGDVVTAARYRLEVEEG